MDSPSVVYENPWFRVRKDGPWHWIEQPGAVDGRSAVVVALCGDRFVFELNLRRALGKSLVEFPRGGANDGEGAEACALRELAEETGFRPLPGTLRKLGCVHPDGGLLSSSVSVFLVEVERTEAETDGEASSIFELSRSEILSAVVSGQITDGFTLSALALLWASESVVFVDQT